MGGIQQGCVGFGARVGAMLCYAMLCYAMLCGVIVVMIPALASIFDICWVITDRCMYGPPPAPALTQPLRVRMLHFPPSGRAGAEAGWCLAMHRFKFTAMYGNYKFEFSIQNIDQHMYMYPPAPTPDQSLESAEAPLSSLGRGQR